jgi:hypothetical protein
MAGIDSRKYKKAKPDLVVVESILESGLQPVSPRREFIETLHTGLMNYTYGELDEPEKDFRRPLVFALIGVIGLFFLFSIWVRLMLVVLSAMGMIQSTKKRRSAS